MTPVLKPTDKPEPKLNIDWIERSIKDANKSTNYPICINIGKHLMNSATQDYLEQLFRKAGYEVERTLEKCMYRYEVLYLHNTHTPKLIHTIGANK